MKKKLRQHVRHLLSGITHERAHLASGQVQRALVGLEEFARASTVMIYMAMPMEADTTDIAQAAWAAGKTVLTPKVYLNDRQMSAMEIRSLTHGLTASHYGILEPDDGPHWPEQEIDFIVVPGLAFDRRGGRLGRGAGFYDRFLEKVRPDAVACGLCFHEQVVEEVPMFDHDRRVDILVTDQEVLRFSGRHGL